MICFLPCLFKIIPSHPSPVLFLIRNNWFTVLAVSSCVQSILLIFTTRFPPMLHPVFVWFLLIHWFCVHALLCSWLRRQPISIPDLWNELLLLTANSLSTRVRPSILESWLVGLRRVTTAPVSSWVCCAGDSSSQYSSCCPALKSSHLFSEMLQSPGRVVGMVLWMSIRAQHLAALYS